MNVHLDPPVTVAGCGLFGPFPGIDGPGLAPGEALAFDDDRFRRLDRVTRLGIRGARAALEEGGILEEDPVRKRCGVFLGNAYGTYPANVAHQRTLLEEGGRASSPAIFTTTLPNVPSGWISIAEKLEGPLMTFAGGLTASAEALAAALLHLRSSPHDLLIAGGAHAYDEEVFRTLQAAGPPGERSPAEGAAFLLLAGEEGTVDRVRLSGAALARTSGGADPLEDALSGAEAEPGAVDGVLVAGDAIRDGEARDRLAGLGFETAALLSALHGDLGEAAPAVAAVLAVRWLQGRWSPDPSTEAVRSVVVTGLDPCARRAFALRFTGPHS